MPAILGILNITDDSFSDGGKYLEPAAALAHARKLMADGADMLDIGAASSNPKAAAIAPRIEMARLAGDPSMLAAGKNPRLHRQFFAARPALGAGPGRRRASTTFTALPIRRFIPNSPPYPQN